MNTLAVKIPIHLRISSSNEEIMIGMPWHRSVCDGLEKAVAALPGQPVGGRCWNGEGTDLHSVRYKVQADGELQVVQRIDSASLISPICSRIEPGQVEKPKQTGRNTRFVRAQIELLFLSMIAPDFLLLGSSAVEKHAP